MELGLYGSEICCAAAATVRLCMKIARLGRPVETAMCDASAYGSTPNKKISLLLNTLGVEGNELYNAFTFKGNPECRKKEDTSAPTGKFDAVLTQV